MKINYFWLFRAGGVVVTGLSLFLAWRLWENRESLNYFELKWGGVACFVMFFAGAAALKMRKGTERGSNAQDKN